MISGTMPCIGIVIYQKILEHFLVPFLDKFYGDVNDNNFFFRQDLVSLYSTKTMSNWFTDHIVLD